MATHVIADDDDVVVVVVDDDDTVAADEDALPGRRVACCSFFRRFSAPAASTLPKPGLSPPRARFFDEAPRFFQFDPSISCC
jgi:hypothetical protein